MSEDPVSLSVIDPELTELDRAQLSSTPAADHVQDALDRADFDGQPTTEANAGVETQEGDGVDKKGKKRRAGTHKPKGIVKGSTADYKRKEANRMAAERSRSRVSERRAYLDEALPRLTDENERLRAEIARLEQQQGHGDEHDRQDRPRDDGADANEAVYNQHLDSQPSLPDQEVESSAGTAVHEPMDAEAEAQAHSRTILAALMSNAEIDEALSGDWMDHVDANELDAGHNQTLQSEVGTAGDPASSTGDTVHHGDTTLDHRTQLAKDDTTSSIPHNQHGRDRSRHMAVALHAGMERHLRDDLASTKAAIDQIERELAVFRGESQTGDSNEPTPSAYVSPLPADYTTTDHAVLASLLSTLDQEVEELSSRMTPLKGTVIELKESRISESDRLLDLLSSLQVGEQDSAVVEKVLEPLKTYLVDLLGNLRPQNDDHPSLLHGSSVAAAIAPRRRGRPPRPRPAGRPQKSHVPKKRSKLSRQLDMGEETSPPPRRRRITKSGLGASLPIHPVEHDPAATGASQPQSQAETEREQDPAHQGAGDLDGHSSQMADTQPELTTEEIISQLTHDEQDLHDLLRSHAQAEYDAEQHAAMGLPSHFGSHSGAGSGSGSGAGEGVDSSNIDPDLGGGGMGVGVGALDGQTGSQPETGEPIEFGTGPPGSCDICGRTQTTVWRKLHLPDRALHVCNACGMYHIKTGHIRPRELWGDGKLIRKRRKTTNPKPFGQGGTPTPNKRFKVKGAGADDGLGLEHGSGEPSESDVHAGLDDGGETLDSQGIEGDLSVDNLGDVVDHDDLRATLGMDGLRDMITGFSDHNTDDVAQNVANVFGSVE